MGIYLGRSGKLKINSSNGGILRLNIPTTSSSPIVNSNILKSLDNYILKDLNGLYLIVKEDK